MLCCLKTLSILLYNNIYALLSLSYCIITFSPHHTSKIRLLRRTLQKLKNQFQYIICLLDAQNMLLIFQKFPSNWWTLTKRWGGTTLVPLRLVIYVGLFWSENHGFRQTKCPQRKQYIICSIFPLSVFIVIPKGICFEEEKNKLLKPLCSNSRGKKSPSSTLLPAHHQCMHR